MKSYLYIAILTLSCFITCSDSNELLLKRLHDRSNSSNKEIKETEQEFSPENLSEHSVCDCGEHSIGCHFENGQKNCTCKEGYAQSNDGNCEECYCGPGELKCSFYLTGYRKCTCKKGFAVTIDSSKKNQTCERCDCGPNALVCILDARENQICTCKNNYAVWSNGTGDKICKKCDCGIPTKTCEFDSKGYRQCTCDDGYFVTSLHSWGGDQECEKKENASSWKIATGVISVFAAFVTVLLLLSLYRNKRLY